MSNPPQLALFAAALAAVLSGCNCDLVVGIHDAGVGGGGASGGAGGGGGGGGGSGGGFVDGGPGGGVGGGVGFDGGGVGSDGGTTCGAPTGPCYTGPPATAGVGVCRAGIRTCTQGMLGQCSGEIVPSTESCNGLDDDCDGIVDNPSVLGTVSCGLGVCLRTVPACVNGRPSNCVPDAGGPENCTNTLDDDCDGVINNGCSTCVHVAPNGSDDAGSGSQSAPFQTIGFAIAKAVSGPAGGAQVCVASSLPNCGISAPSTAVYNEAVVMHDGVSVYGGYQNPADGGAWTRPPSQTVLLNNGTVTRLGCATVINGVNDRGVYFDHQIASPTSIDGFSINAAANPDAGVAGTAAVTVQGSTGVVINDNLITGVVGASAAQAQKATFGVVVDGRGYTNPIAPIISNNAIIGGGGLVSIGVRSMGAAPLIQDNCTTFDTAGRCVDFGCESACTVGSVARRFIRARAFANGSSCPALASTQAVVSIGVSLESSPDATVSRSAICTTPATGDAAAVRISGNGAGVTVRANHLQAEGAAMLAINSVGVWADTCDGGSPWVVNNSSISGSGRTLGSRGDGVRAVGDCPIRVDSNLAIVGGLESSQNDAYGVYCAKDKTTGASSRCTVTNNLDIAGSGGGFPPVSAGIRCDDGACARIEGNSRVSGRGGVRSFGIILGNTGTFVARNMIEAGCAQTLGVGLLSDNSFARIENNVIGGSRWTTATGNGCGPGNASAKDVYGILAVLAGGPNELDVHSNDVFAFGTSSAISCTGRAIAFDVLAPCNANPCPVPVINVPTGPRGIVRNNFLHASFGNSSVACATTYVVEEADLLADPRVFENNDLWFSGPAPTALYRNEGLLNLGTAAAVNAMNDITVSGVLSVPPSFLSGFNFPVTPITAIGTVPTTDVHLAPGSALVDAGTSAGAPSMDFYGTARPRGPSWDIGAHEQ